LHSVARLALISCHCSWEGATLTATVATINAMKRKFVSTGG